MPGGFVCSASAKGRCSAQEVLDVSDGNIATEIPVFPQASAISTRRMRRPAFDEGSGPAGPTFLFV